MTEKKLADANMRDNNRVHPFSASGGDPGLVSREAGPERTIPNSYPGSAKGFILHFCHSFVKDIENVHAELISFLF